MPTAPLGLPLQLQVAAPQGLLLPSYTCLPLSLFLPVVLSASPPLSTNTTAGPVN